MRKDLARLRIYVPRERNTELRCGVAAKHAGHQRLFHRSLSQGLDRIPGAGVEEKETVIDITRVSRLVETQSSL